ncbi:MAG: YfhO family protein [bacterium]|nr:YfhO family protein [bacterium]
MKLNQIKNHWPEIIILVAIFLLLRDLLLFGKIFIPPDYGLGDATRGMLPVTHYLSQALREGRLPLWSPEILNGFPVAADGESGIFYPVILLLFYIFPHAIALNFFTLITFLIMGFSTFYFLKSQKLSKEASLVGALSFTFSSGIIVKMNHLVQLGTIAFLPLTLLLAQKYFEKKNPLLFFLTGIILSFEILNFNPPATLISFAGFSLFSLYLVLTTSTKTKEFFSGLLFIAFAFFLAFFLSAVLIIPGLKVVSQSQRSTGIEETQKASFAFHPEELAYFLRPAPFGDYSLNTYRPPSNEANDFFWENNTYIGLVGLFLGLFAILQIFHKTKKSVLFFSFLFFFSIILALGPYTPLSFLDKIPPLSYLRAPGRFLILSMFSLAALSAFGFDKLTEKFSSKRPILGGIAAFIILLDLFSFGLFYNPTYNPQKWLAPPQTAQFLMKDPSFFRTFVFGDYDAFFAVHESGSGWRKDITPYYNLRESLPPDMNMIYGLNYAQGWVALQTQRSLDWEGLLNMNIKIYPKLSVMEPNDLALKMLRMQNVKYLITPFKTNIKDLSLEKEVDFDTGQVSFNIYRLSAPLPHAFIVHQTQTLPISKILNEISRDNFDPQKTVLLEEKISKTNELPNQQGNDKAEVTSYLPEKVVVRTEAENGGYLVLTDSYFPGWEAKIDNKPVKIYQADYLFRAVKLEPGNHEVIFEYKPKDIYLGAKISIGTLIVILILSLWWIIYKKR